MKIKVLTHWYNEADIAHFFLRHYSFADEIHIAIDDATTDNSEEICRRYDNVHLTHISYPWGFDDVEVTKKIGSEIDTEKDVDWMFIVDSDELIFAPEDENMRHFLERQTGNIVKVDLYQVYRNVKDSDLNPGLPAKWQRRHGNPAIHYEKPIVLKPETKAQFVPGQHYTKSGKLRFCNEHLMGAHWQVMEPDWAIKRLLLNRAPRMSEERLKQGYAVHYSAMTAESLTAECEAHKNDPKLW